MADETLPPRALISDVTGPVGRRVAARLVAAGWQVRGVAGREDAPPPPKGVKLRGWPRTPGAFGRGLKGVRAVVLTDLASAPEDPAACAERLAGLIEAAVRAGVPRLVALNSAAVYAAEALATGTVDETGPFAARGDAGPLTRAAMELERAVASAAQRGIAATVLRNLPALARDCPAAQAMIREIWRTGRPPEGVARLQGIDADELAEMVERALERPAAAGRAVNVAGPVAVSAESAAAEIRRLGMMLVDDSDTSIRVRPAYPPVPPVLSTARAAALLGVRPKKRIWVSFAEVLQELIRQDRAAGRLPPVRTGLPPALAALEAGSQPLAGRRAVMTDAATPSAAQLAGMLLRLGAELRVVARDEAEAEALRARHPGAARRGALRPLVGDMALLGDVRRLAAALCDEGRPVDLLLHTACRLHERREQTEEGNERTLAANLLGPFLLTNLLAEALAAAPQPQLVSVISDVHADAPVDLQDIQNRVAFTPAMALGRAHAGLLICNTVLAELAHGSGLRISTIAPRPERSETWRLPPLPVGDELIGAQELQRRQSLRNRMLMQMTSPRDVASHIADLAVVPPAEAQGGVFVTFDGPAPPAPHTRDRAVAGALWNLCREICGLGG